MIKPTTLSFIFTIYFGLSAYGGINLEFQPTVQVVEVCDIVEVGLYAVSDSTFDQRLSYAQVIFEWEPAFLRLLGHSDEGGALLRISEFPRNDPSGLNEVVPPADGDGFYIAAAFFSSPVRATPDGTLLTTFLFFAESRAHMAMVDIVENGGMPLIKTAVFDSSGVNVTGSLLGAEVQIQRCIGDLDGDGDVDGDDMNILLGCWGFTCGDLNGDETTDELDVLILLANWGQCLSC